MRPWYGHWCPGVKCLRKKKQKKKRSDRSWYGHWGLLNSYGNWGLLNLYGHWGLLNSYGHWGLLNSYGYWWVNKNDSNIFCPWNYNFGYKKFNEKRTYSKTQNLKKDFDNFNRFSTTGAAMSCLHHSGCTKTAIRMRKMVDTLMSNNRLLKKID